MNLYDTIIVILVFLGALIILLSANYIKKIFNLLTDLELKKNWEKLRFLILLFFVAYIGVIVLVLFGKTSLLAILSGAIFFMGSLFVFLVVVTGLESFKKLNKAHKVLDTQEIKNEELEEFAHVVSHDLKAPLRGISSLASFIKEDVQSGNIEDVEEHFFLLQERVQHLENLINGILEYSKIGKLKNEEIDLNALLKEEFVIFNKLNNLTYTIEKTLPTIYGDKLQLLQVFSNLINNAVKYSDKDICHVKVSFTELPMHFEIVLGDNGPGIEPKYHHKIFEVFQTLDQSSSTDSTGIGLSIVKKIIEKHQGSIYVKSDGKLGTRFVIIYPKKRL